MEFLRLFLLPLAFFYGLITRLRNILFSIGILPSTSFDLPVISVGNLSAGGTGKTPHVEYLIRLLSNNYNLATISRGYKRKTSGYIIAGDDDHSGTIGDEPAQFHRKFPGITVVADESRRHGIRTVLSEKPQTDLIILDDAYQHRYVKPGLSILLTDYHKLYSNDYVLPFGTLRESRSGSKRANIIVVTKTPNVLSPFERQRITKCVKPSPYQKVLFSFIKYGEIRSLWNESEEIDKSAKYSVILLVAGIANSYPLEYELRSKCSDLIIMRFKDHHKYSVEDLKLINGNYSDIYTRNKLLVTTEKDAMRLLDPEVKKQAQELPIYYQSMEVDFHPRDKQIFDETIKKYVRENKRER